MSHAFTKFISSKTFALLTAAAIVPVALVVHARPGIDESGSIPSSVADSLGRRLYAVADYWGDSLGRIDFTVTGTNQTMYVALANPGGPFSIYYNGQNVPDNSTMAACALNTAGAPVGCDLDYGETLLFALEDLVDEEVDPTAATLECEAPIVGLVTHCWVTFAGSSTCYACDMDGVCWKGCY